MTKVSRTPENVGLRLCQRLVQDHGDALRLSLSKKGRIWLTFTHWDNEKYNTSVELDGMADVDDLMGAFAVLAVAHYAKCFRGMAHVDSWNGIDETRALVADCLAQCSRYLDMPEDNVSQMGDGAAAPTDNAK